MNHRPACRSPWHQAPTSAGGREAAPALTAEPGPSVGNATFHGPGGKHHLGSLRNGSDTLAVRSHPLKTRCAPTRAPPQDVPPQDGAGRVLWGPAGPACAFPRDWSLLNLCGINGQEPLSASGGPTTGGFPTEPCVAKLSVPESSRGAEPSVDRAPEHCHAQP